MSPDTFWLTAARSETGYIRTSNEDRMGWTRTAFGDVFVVSDGMGGYRGGALAAEITVSSLQKHLGAIAPGEQNFGERIRHCFQQANLDVYSQRNPDDPETSEMGATAVALIRDGNQVRVAHVGDSRAYLLRGGTRLRQLTRDHTRIQALMESSALAPEDAATHPDVGVLERAMGRSPSVDVEVGDWIDVLPGDVWLLCSDGLYGDVSDEVIESTLRSARQPTVAADRLIEGALGNGGHDNVTVQLLQYAPSRWWLARQRISQPPVLLSVGIITFLGIALFAQMRTSRAEVTGLRARLSQAAGEINALKATPPSGPKPACVGEKPAVVPTPDNNQKQTVKQTHPGSIPEPSKHRHVGVP